MSEWMNGWMARPHHHFISQNKIPQIIGAPLILSSQMGKSFRKYIVVGGEREREREKEIEKEEERERESERDK